MSAEASGVQDPLLPLPDRNQLTRLFKTVAKSVAIGRAMLNIGTNIKSAIGETRKIKKASQGENPTCK